MYVCQRNLSLFFCRTNPLNIVMRHPPFFPFFIPIEIANAIYQNLCRRRIGGDRGRKKKLMAPTTESENAVFCTHWQRKIGFFSFSIFLPPFQFHLDSGGSRKVAHCSSSVCVFGRYITSTDNMRPFFRMRKGLRIASIVVHHRWRRNCLFFGTKKVFPSKYILYTSSIFSPQRKINKTLLMINLWSPHVF